MNIIEPSFRGQLFAEDVLARAWVPDLQGQRKPIRGSISKGEIRVLATLISDTRAKRTLETGVALGVSTLAMTQAVARNGGCHVGIDPLQMQEHNGAALATISEFGLQGSFSLREGPSHMEMPKLLSAGERFDVIFIDGAHQFNFKFIDSYYADLLLDPDGWLIFHDLLLPSTKKIWRYIQTQQRYHFVATPQLQPRLSKKVRYLVGAFLKRKPLRTSWPNSFGNLLVLRKVSDKPAQWDLFFDF